MTEARAYIGMKALFEGRAAEGVEHLQWVAKNGSRHYTEYQMALGELKRIKSQSSTSAGSAP